ncbi:hypothetical protein PCARR_a0210 [Pseudoalteromonas carrageenovora IAM 12662]|uniref:Uncharacterized protein n=1 Tax=Pseudoalteromonas carrageenovora IAM 12662 TaxID=1314868 RepID=A0ABR9EN47_PSEVC|nr:hypothetical protein [Pseudoalteromonas carrageenovora IAM 12662]
MREQASRLRVIALGKGRWATSGSVLNLLVGILLAGSLV